MSGHTYTYIHTHIHTHTHTHTHDNYYNPRCAHAHRGLIIYSTYIPRRILGIIIMERRGGQYSVTNCRNVGAMLGCRCDVSAFNLRRSMCRNVGAMLGCRCDVSAFNLRRSMCRPSKIDVSTFEDRRSMCRPSKIDGVVSTFEDH